MTDREINAAVARAMGHDCEDRAQHDPIAEQEADGCWRTHCRLCGAPVYKGGPCVVEPPDYLHTSDWRVIGEMWDWLVLDHRRVSLDWNPFVSPPALVTVVDRTGHARAGEAGDVSEALARAVCEVAEARETRR